MRVFAWILWIIFILFFIFNIAVITGKLISIGQGNKVNPNSNIIGTIICVAAFVFVTLYLFL